MVVVGTNYVGQHSETCIKPTNLVCETESCIKRDKRDRVWAKKSGLCIEVVF